MSDKAYESLSALMDNETDEFETRRLLSQYSEQPELREKWIRYQQVSATLSGAKDATLDVDLSKRIALDIDDEPFHQSGADSTIEKAKISRFLRPMGSVAIAASVTVLVVIGAQRFTMSDLDSSLPAGFASQDDASSYQIDGGAMTSQKPDKFDSGYVPIQLASAGSRASGGPVTQSTQKPVVGSQQDTWSVSDKQLDGVDLYLQQHARNAISSGMGGIPFAQTASFKIDE